ncbi:FmdB family zinc ribbon protein [Nitrospira lenta]|uniref:FmdB family zinc ribbon protein n=1 Tax=Nitrospira lenta TaxID=1436998 RepID=UPI0015E8DEC5|nr:FmdB family zinc ribbon protein [Nitrospira lenta]
MPIYEYLCHDCSYTFELKQSMKDEAIATCSKCGKSVSRIISAPAIMFKGSGWYITDYSDKMKPPTGETTKPTPTATTTAAESSATPAATSSSTPAAPSAPPASGGTTSSSTPSASSTPASSPTSGQK